MHGSNPGIALEIDAIEAENVTEAIRIKNRGQPSVMHSHAAYCVHNDQAPPFEIDLFVIRQEREGSLNFPGARIRLLNAQPEPVILQRAGRGIPELGHVLHRIKQNCPSIPKGCYGSAYQRILGMIALDQSKQDIAVNQVRIVCFQS